MRSVPFFGGKTARLGEMIRAGLAVPRGFGISVGAYEEFKGSAFSAQFRQELLSAFESLDSPRVAVRSSAIAEDSGTASWAGQLETSLNVSLESLEAAIRRCWASIDAPHVAAYLESKKMSNASRLVGVAVQSMVESDVSGVMFTADPVDGSRDTIVIEAIYGLGEPLVGGLVTPDNYRYSKSAGTVTNFDIRVQKKKMAFDGRRNAIADLPESEGDRATLQEAQVLTLAKLGLKIEKHYGQPQDIEWALKGQKFYLLQSRPITC